MRKKFCPFFLIANGPTHEILVLVAYAQKPPFIVHADIFGRARGLIFGWILYPEPYVVYVQVAKAQASLRQCEGLPEPLYLDKVISTKMDELTCWFKYPFDERICCL